MIAFKERLLAHAKHVENVGAHCTTEETTKQALILPLLDILGFSPFDPTRVKAEYGADFPGAKNNERVDYALFCHNVPVMYIEAKPFGANLTNHSPQLSRYFNATPEVAVAAITNGSEWRFFTDLSNKNMMDATPFFSFSFADIDDAVANRLYRFRHDEFQPDALRTLAEESVYISAFQELISAELRQPSAEFVRYIAGRANVQRQLNAKFLDSLTPLIKQAVELAVSAMVVSGLSAKPVAQPVPPDVVSTASEDGDIVDPENSKIVTTVSERRLLEMLRQIVGPEDEITGKDTESYYAALYMGKSNRWLVRYWGDKKVPAVQCCLPMTPERRSDVIRAGLSFAAGDTINLGAPENILRLAPLVLECLSYCKNDDNFRRAGQAEG